MGGRYRYGHRFSGFNPSGHHYIAVSGPEANQGCGRPTAAPTTENDPRSTDCVQKNVSMKFEDSYDSQRFETWFTNANFIFRRPEVQTRYTMVDSSLD